MVSTGDERYGVNETGVDRVRSFDVECRCGVSMVSRKNGFRFTCRWCQQGVSTVPTGSVDGDAHPHFSVPNYIWIVGSVPYNECLPVETSTLADDRIGHEFAFLERLKRRKKCDATSQYELANMPVNNFGYMKAATPQNCVAKVV